MLILESNINQRVSNKVFEEKKKEYTTSDLSYAKLIAAKSSDVWDFNSIQERQKDMAKEALSIWRYY